MDSSTKRSPTSTFAPPVVMKPSTSATAGSSRHHFWFGITLYAVLLRLLAGTLIFVLCLWILAGIVHMAIALNQLFYAGWAAASEQVISDSLIILALLEVIRTLQAYLKLGRIRVTFILDTVLVVLIGELMGLWFHHYNAEKVILGLGVIAVLVLLRIVTARFSPVAVGRE